MRGGDGCGRERGTGDPNVSTNQHLVLHCVAEQMTAAPEQIAAAPAQGGHYVHTVNVADYNEPWTVNSEQWSSQLELWLVHR